MSGGSYNYLYGQDSLDHGDLTSMAARLAELAPGSAAARDTAALVRAIDNQRLREVWRAVEWLDSHDYSADQVDAAVREYEVPED